MMVPRAPARWLSALLLLASTGGALLVAEWVLRAQRTGIEASSDMDPGLLRYDAHIGWTLKPLWHGRHRHADFDVAYSTGIDGWRVSPAGEGKIADRVVYWVGDSYTFGFGVDDAETFVNQLNEREPGIRHVNAGIPGVATDQELLLIERRILGKRPARVALMVYLGNDLFDNRLPFPLQAENAKPYFELSADGRLQAHQIPVPRRRKPEGGDAPTLSQFVLGDAASASSLASLASRSEILRRLGWRPRPGPAWEAGLATRHRDELALFMALLTRLRGAVDEAGARLEVHLLPSRRAVEEPHGTMARLQDFLAGEILTRTAAEAIAVRDLTPCLRAADADSGVPLYHPNEGHFTVAGHRAVADCLEAPR